MIQMINTKIYITFLFISVFLVVSAQEDKFKDFAEEHSDRAFCFYPSTIRMLNVGNNPEFNNMVSDIEKILVYKLDSISIADKLYSSMLDDFRSLGYEEFISVNGGGMETRLLGNLQNPVNQYIGVFINDDISLTFYMKGDISLEKIPNLISSFNNDDFINIMDLDFNEFEKHH